MLGPINPTKITFDAPQVNADGTPLVDLKSYNIYVSQSSSGPWTFGFSALSTAQDPPAGSSVTIMTPNLSLANGQWWGTLTAVDMVGNESVKAAPVPFGIGDVVAPGPPLNLVVS